MWISYSFPPEAGVGALRVTHFIKHLDGSGTASTVISGPFDGARRSDPGLAAELPGSCRVVRTNTRFRDFWIRLSARLPRSEPSRRRFHLEWGSLYQGHWIESAVSSARSLDAHRLVISTGPPFSAHEIARRIRERSRIPWIMDVRDPWPFGPDPASDEFRSKREARWFSSVAAVVATTSEILDVLHGRGLPASVPTRVIPNGFDDRECPPLLSPWPPEKFCLLYTGNLYGERRIDDVLQAVSRLVERGSMDRDAIEILLVGQAYPPPPIPENLREGCRLFPLVPRAELRSYWERSAVLLLLQPEAYRMCVPTKLFEFLAIGRPILAVVPLDSPSARLIREFGTGHVVAPGDSSSLERTLLDFYTSWRSGTLRPPGRGPGLERYERSRLAKLLEEFLPAAHGC